jgi:CubicO group peptidase (beta-lactamase class C family)
VAVLLLAVTARAPSIAAAPDPPRPVTELTASFERDLDRWARRDRVPAAAAAIVHDGELVWEGAAGTADRESRAGAGSDTVFQVASLSKPVTALGVMLLAEEGRLDLDRPIWDYVRGWRLPPSEHDAGRVTARLLLGHRAGVGVHGYPGYEPDRPLPTLLGSLDGDNGGAGAATLVAEPGTTTLYSSGGYAILQLAIEQITGEPFAGYMQRRVLDPLAMTHSSFEPPIEVESASGHGWWGDRLPAYRFREQAASGLYATAGDVARFLAVLSSPSAQRAVGVSATTIETMLEPATGGSFALGFAVDASAARTAGGAIAPGPRIVWHNGSNRGFRAVLAAAPDSGDAFVVLTNSDRGLALTDDLFCEWGLWLTGLESATCWVERKRRGTLVAVAGLAALGTLMDGAAFARRRSVRRARAAAAAGGRRAWAEDARHRPPPRASSAWASHVRLTISIALLLGWWIYWYTDRVALHREGIAHFVPVSSQPPTFFWLTAVVTAWCLLGVARWASERVEARR